jgi:hypothetical protein
MSQDMILKKRNAPRSQTSKKGNILFLILIAVALFAALSYTVTQMGRTPGNTIENEKTKLSQAEIDSYTAQLNQGKTRLELINNCQTIDYTPPADQVAGDKSCHMFHPDGAGVAYRDFGDTCPSDDILVSLAVGERCGAMVYAGEVGGSRLYTTVGDQGQFSWNNGSANYSNTGATSTSNGAANTDTLITLSDAGAPYEAANACRALGTEWYLPAQDELELMRSRQADIGGFVHGQRYWASTETSISDAYQRRFSPPNAATEQPKEIAHSVRCVRR